MAFASIQERWRHNASTPVSRLPVELLICIFFDVVNERWEGSLHENAYTAVEKLRAVCFLWNSLVSVTPSLWAFASRSWPRCKVLRALALSLDKPITVEGREFWQTNEDFMPLLLPHAWRWKVAYIAIPNNQLESDIYHYLYLNHLEELWIDNERQRSGPHLAFERSRLPALRRLTLVEQSIPWDSALISGLKFLDIGLEGSLDISTRDLIAIFERNPTLEELHHSSISFARAAEAVMSLDGPHIIMERLYFLEIHGPHNVAHLIFDRIRFPALREGKIVLWEADPNSPMFATTPLRETIDHIASKLFPDTFNMWFHKAALQLAFRSASRDVTVDIHWIFYEDEAKLCEELGSILGSLQARVQRSTITTYQCTSEEWKDIDSAMAFREIIIEWPESSSPPHTGALARVEPPGCSI